MDKQPYATLVQRYRQARQLWAQRPEVQSQAELIGLSERDYCEVIVTGKGPLAGTTEDMYAAAWEEVSS